MDDFDEGYMDGRDKDCPEPSENRSEKYKHSFWVGRGEINGFVIPAAISRIKSEIAERKDNEK